MPIYLYTDDPQFIAAVPAAQTDKNLYSGIDNGGVYIAVPRMSGLKAPELTLNLRMLLTQQIVATMSGGNLPPGLLHGTRSTAKHPRRNCPHSSPRSISRRARTASPTGRRSSTPPTPRSPGSNTASSPS